MRMRGEEKKKNDEDGNTNSLCTSFGDDSRKSARVGATSTGRWPSRFPATGVRIGMTMSGEHYLSAYNHRINCDESYIRVPDKWLDDEGGLLLTDGGFVQRE